MDGSMAETHIPHRCVLTLAASCMTVYGGRKATVLPFRMAAILLRLLDPSDFIKSGDAVYILIPRGPLPMITSAPTLSSYWDLSGLRSSP